MTINVQVTMTFEQSEWVKDLLPRPGETDEQAWEARLYDNISEMIYGNFYYDQDEENLHELLAKFSERVRQERLSPREAKKLAETGDL